MGDQIPVIVEKPIADCGYRKFQVDSMGDHLCNCTVHSGVKKAHDWVVEQLTNFFRTTHHTKTQHVTKNRGRHCGDIQLEEYLVNTTGPVSLVMDLRIAHDRFGSSSDPSLNGHLHYPNDIDKSYIRLLLIKYGNIVLTITIIPLAQSPLCLLLLVRLEAYIVNSLDYYSHRLIGKLTAFLQFQEFRLRNQVYVLHSILMGRLSLQEHILTHHTRKHLVY
jgi:hypothetical protein